MRVRQLLAGAVVAGVASAAAAGLAGAGSTTTKRPIALCT